MLKLSPTILFAFFLLTNAAFTQNIPFPQSDAFWKEQFTGIAGPFNRLFAICADSTTNGVDYQVVKGFHLAMGTDSILGPLGGTTLIRSEGQQVFIKYGNESEILLYDFSLEEGDSITLDVWNFPVTLHVQSVEFQMIAGLLRKVIYFELQPGAPQEYWIEGIGSSYGLLERAFFAIDAEGALLCFRNMDQEVNFTAIECFFPEIPEDCDFVNATGDVMPRNTDLLVYPNPSSQVVFISMRNDLPHSNWKISVFSY